LRETGAFLGAATKQSRTNGCEGPFEGDFLAFLKNSFAESGQHFIFAALLRNLGQLSSQTGNNVR